MGLVALVVAREPDDVHVGRLEWALGALGHETRRIAVAEHDDDVAYPRLTSIDAVVVPNGILDFEQAPRSAQLLREAADRGLIVGALGLGVEALADAGIAFGRHLSTPSAVVPEMEEKGGNPSDDAVTIDGRFVTASSPADLVAFVGALDDAMRAGNLTGRGA